ncbi:hypothetical protein BJY00DRAFT_307659 [Aspergillus carlsbadensis]|nr:hypothetical protein BJY00DRAFT_307659 [Aspergillus carlsbadensis]
MATLLGLSREILGQVFASCDGLRQVTAFASACKLLHSVWDNDASRIIWSVARSEIFLFDQAFVLIRATALVTKHLQNAELPPHPLPLASLSGDVVNPTLAALHFVLSVEHLVRCMRARRCARGDSGDHQYGTRREGKELCEECVARGENVHSAFYRLFLIAAALCGSFQEPLLSKDANRPMDFLVQYKREVEAAKKSEGSEGWEAEQVLSASDIGYLIQFPVHRLQYFDSYDFAFGELAEASRSRVRGQPAGAWICTLESHEHTKLPSWWHLPEEADLFTEMTHLLAAWAWVNGNQFLPSMYSIDDEALRTSSGLRKVTLIDPQSFFPVEWTTPGSIPEAMDLGVTYETARLTPDPSSESPSGYVGSLYSLLELMWSESGQSNHYTDECTVACYSLQFFEYMFRNYLGMRFADDAFLHNPGYGPFKGWVGMLNVFENPWIVPHESDPQGTFVRVDLPPGDRFFSPESFS